jgi:hypothetical protein
MSANTRGNLHVNYRRLLSSFDENCDVSIPTDVKFDGKALECSGNVTHSTSGLDGLTLHTRSLHAYIHIHIHTHTYIHMALWLRRCATSRKVPGSIPGRVTGDFFRVHVPGVD